MENTAEKTRNGLPKVLLALISLEFIYGTLASLYQEIPEGEAKYDVYKSVGIILFHVLIALVLFVLGLIYMVRTKKQKASRKELGASIGGFMCILLALASGATFVDTGNDIFSFTMMFFALGALLSYAQIVFRKQ